MKKRLILILFFGCFATNAQSKKTTLNIFTFEEVEKLHQQKPKPIVVFIYTDWCNICHAMKKNTFKNEEIITFLNDQFYFIKLNAEDTNDIQFLGQTFKHKPSGFKTGTHELAIELASIKGSISYPTTTFLNSRLEITIQINYYINSITMYSLLKKQHLLKEY